ncbi:MAG: extensin family protein [Deltaproteobacteria bacterium]|nr:extensin family protein [Deltaproteobacteria bacterium]
MLRSAALVAVSAIALSGCGSREVGPAPVRPPPVAALPPAAPPAVSASARADTPPEPAPPPAASAQTFHDPWRGNTDPTDNWNGGPPEVFADCESRLTSEGVTWRKASLPMRSGQGGKHTCGAPQVVIYERGPAGIGWNSPLVSCGMAIAMARFERIVREESMKHLKHAVTGVLHGTAYQCRPITATTLASEHSFANAMDLFGFVLDDHRQVSVLLQFGPTSEASVPPEGQFLRSLARRLFDEAIFSNVLTPYFNADHRDHIHVDLARYRVDGTR